MRKAIVIVNTGVRLDPKADHKIIEIANSIIANTVIVRTPECVGEGVSIAGKIFTSLLLVRNHTMVSVISSGAQTQAVVESRDEPNFLAKLRPISLGLSSRSRPTIKNKEFDFNVGPIGAHGDPLFLTDTSDGAPAVTVAAVTYSINISERVETGTETSNVWRFDPNLPQGLVGSGVWNIDGKFVGLSLGRKIPFNSEAIGASNRFFALPANVVMDFAEKS